LKESPTAFEISEELGSPAQPVKSKYAQKISMLNDLLNK